MSRTIITEEIGNKIIEMYKSGNNINQIRLYFNNSPGFAAVKRYLQRAGLIEKEKVYRGYTYEQCMEIGEYYINNEWECLYEKYPKLNKQTVYDICSYYEITKDSYFWTKEDEEILRQKYNVISTKELEVLMAYRHTAQAIRTKAEKMGLGKDPFWSAEEEKILKDNYSFIPKNEMCLLLPNRTPDAIMNHAKLLEIKSYQYLNEKYNPEAKQFIVDNWQVMTDQEIADAIGKTARGVMEQRNNMKLFRISKDYSGYENIAKFLRGHIQDWKTASMEQCNYVCIFTGSKDYAIHHIVGFNIILAEAFKQIEEEIPLRSNVVADYSINELNRMIDIFQEVHSKYPLGVCVRKDIHDLFHRIYGAGGNNQSQWDKFVEDYKQGKYK